MVIAQAGPEAALFLIPRYPMMLLILYLEVSLREAEQKGGVRKAARVVNVAGQIDLSLAWMENG